MRAIICKEFGPPSSLVVGEVENPKAGPNEVVVRVKACGLNFPDTLIIQGLYQVRPPLPFIPGSDFAGVIKEVGHGVTHLQVGDEVFGFVQHGALAEEVLVEVNSCFIKPVKMPFSIAASFMVAYGTSYHALKDRARLQKGETVLVLGASGGVGLAAIELAKLMGARVIAAASTKEKLELCLQRGADHTINYSTEDLKQSIKNLTNNKGVDVIYDPVGGDFSEAAFRGIARNGRLLVVGFTTGQIPKIPLNLPLLKSASLVGVFWGNFVMQEPKSSEQNMLDLLNWYQEGKLSPYIQKTYPLEQTSEALEAMMNRQVKGKLVIEM